MGLFLKRAFKVGEKHVKFDVTGNQNNLVIFEKTKTL